MNSYTEFFHNAIQRLETGYERVPHPLMAAALYDQVKKLGEMLAASADASLMKHEESAANAMGVLNQMAEHLQRAQEQAKQTREVAPVDVETDEKGRIISVAGRKINRKVINQQRTA